MDVENFRENAKQLVDFICSYFNGIHAKPVSPSVEPGFMKFLLQDEAPTSKEEFETIMDDVERKIIPGIVQYNHPNMFAFFPNTGSFASILGDMLSSTIGGNACTWACSPSMTELECIMLDWLAKALDLPEHFFSANSNPDSKGLGVLQGSSSEGILIALIAARDRTIQRLKRDPNDDEYIYSPQLVAYASREAHSSIVKAAKIALVKLRILEPDDHDSLRGYTLEKAIKEDVKNGLTPCFVMATLGTTSQCAFDNLVEISDVIKKYPKIWLHVDGAYAGNSFILPEMRIFKKGMEHADSFNISSSKLLLIHCDAAVLWLRNSQVVKSALSVDPVYLQHQHSTVDFRHFSIALSRRARALKLFFVFRMYGIEGLQKHVRNHIQLAKYFESLVRKDERFEIRNDVHLGLVCFRLKNTECMNRKLLAKINSSGKIHLTPAMVKGKYTIRFCVAYDNAIEEHIENAWSVIQETAEEILLDGDPLNNYKKY